MVPGQTPSTSGNGEELKYLLLLEFSLHLRTSSIRIPNFFRHKFAEQPEKEDAGMASDSSIAGKAALAAVPEEVVMQPVAEVSF